MLHSLDWLWHVEFENMLKIKRQPRPMNLNFKVKACGSKNANDDGCEEPRVTLYCIKIPRWSFSAIFLSAVSPLSVAFAWKPRASNASEHPSPSSADRRAWRQPQHGGRFLVVVVTRFSIERARRPNTPRRHGPTKLIFQKKRSTRECSVFKNCAVCFLKVLLEQLFWISTVGVKHPSFF